jgi:glycosyltransferase involved in cell wall biosynthesis
VEYEQIPAVLGDADVGIVCFLPDPNNINAGPTKLFEYMAAGLPILASHFPLWKAIVEGSECGVCVDPTQPQEIAAGLDYLHARPAARRQMGANGKAAVAARYNWEAEGQRLIQLYTSLLAGR